jgi:hypothetical protein
MGLLAASSAMGTWSGTVPLGPLVRGFGYWSISPIAMTGLLGAAVLTRMPRAGNRAEGAGSLNMARNQVLG